MGTSGQKAAEAIEVENFGQGFFLYDFGGESRFFFLQSPDFFFDRIFCDQAVGVHGIDLADTVSAIDGLGLYGWIPPRIIQDDVRRRSEIKAKASGFERKKENGF